MACPFPCLSKENYSVGGMDRGARKCGEEKGHLGTITAGTIGWDAEAGFGARACRFAYDGGAPGGRLFFAARGFDLAAGMVGGTMRPNPMAWATACVLSPTFRRLKIFLM